MIKQRARFALFFAIHIIFAIGVTNLATAEDKYKAIVDAFAEVGPRDTRPLPKEFTAYLREIPRMKSSRHIDIINRYEKTHKLFQKSFPEFAKLEINKDVLSTYEGSKRLVDPEVFGAPFFLITPRSFAGPDSRAFRRTLIVNGVKIPILYITTKARQDAYQQKGVEIFEQYLATLNARAFGFTHAQLISNLSVNVSTAPQFGYNGLRDWSQHSRLRRMDQVKRPIELTNYAHTNGSLYSISAHPDFSIILSNFRDQSILLTFFLWTAETEKLPDLIFQVEYKQRK